MEFRQVRYFLAVYKEQNISRAARLCGIAQPTLSKSLARLEAELGGTLFLRGKRRTLPTALAELVKDAFEQIQQAELTVRQAAGTFARRAELSQIHGDANAQVDVRSPGAADVARGRHVLTDGAGGGHAAVGPE